MKIDRLPSRWQSAAPALRAVQIAFDVSESVLQAVRTAAFEAGLSNSDQVRVLLELPIIRQAKRPRLTVSLSSDDYQLLGKRYRLDPADHLRIKERVGEELSRFAQHRAHGSSADAPKRPGSTRKSDTAATS